MRSNFLQICLEGHTVAIKQLVIHNQAPLMQASTFADINFYLMFFLGTLLAFVCACSRCSLQVVVKMCQD